MNMAMIGNNETDDGKNMMLFCDLFETRAARIRRLMIRLW